MAIVDPWGGYNQGLSTLSSAITGMQDRQRQGRLDDMAMQQNQRAMRLSDLQYADLERKAQEDQQLRDTLASAHGSTQYVPQQGMSLASIGAPSQGLPSRAMPWESPAPQPTTGPQVGMDNKFTPPNPAAITAQVRMGQGRTEEAMKAISLDDALAQYGAKVQAGGGDIRQFYEAKAKLDQGKEFFEAVKPFAKDTKTLKAMWPLLTKVYPQAAAIAPESLTETTNGIATPVMTPDGKPVPGKYMLYDNDGKLHIVDQKQSDAGAHNITEIPSKDGKSAQKFQYNPQTQRYDIPVGGAYVTKSQVPSVNVHTSMDAPEDVNAWAKAVKEGRANLADVPNRGTMRSKIVKALEAGGGVDYQANAADNAGFKSSITQQQKQIGAMGSFVKNMDAQIGKVEKLSKDLSTFDTRLLNVPLRAIRGRVAGSPEQAKYDMYLTEIESEIGKLATGSAASVSELSVGAQQKWAKIHDKNLSVADMLSLLKETSAAGRLRMKSVQDQLAETRQQQRSRGGTAPKTVGRFTIEVE